MSLDPLEELASLARTVYEEVEEAQRQREREVSRAEEEAQLQAEQQAQACYEKALLLLQEVDLPSVLFSWMRRPPTQQPRLRIRLQPPPPFGCSHCYCDLEPHLEDGTVQYWSVSYACERIPSDLCNRTVRWPPEALRRNLLWQLEYSRREHARWADMEAEDAAARAELEQRLQAIKAQMFPEGATLTLYEIRFLRAPLLEEGELEEVGWSLTDRPDAEGYITLEPTRHCTKRRQIQWNSSLHRPLIFKHTISSLDQLPSELTERRELQIQGFRVLQEEERIWLVRDPEGTVRKIENIPLPWIQELLLGTRP